MEAGLSGGVTNKLTFGKIGNETEARKFRRFFTRMVTAA
jgi:hypothetical protein